MKFSTKTRYGMRAMVEIAKSDQKKGILQKSISKNQGISVKYLDQIILGLKNSGLIENVKGKKSGYRLARKPAEITVLQIHLAFEKEIAVVNCISENMNCEMEEQCSTFPFWSGLNKIVIDYFTQASLEDLVNNKHLY